MHLHVETLGLLDERGGHGQEHDVGVQVRRAVVRVEALDARVVHLADDGRHHVEPGEAATWQRHTTRHERRGKARRGKSTEGRIGIELD